MPNISEYFRKGKKALKPDQNKAERPKSDKAIHPQKDK